MAKAEVQAGICGFNTTIQTEMVDDICKITIQSDCPAIQRMALDLTQVDPLQEISSRRKVPQTLQMGLKYCTHSACSVPVGIIKAVEVEAGLALPADVTITVSK
ncbi:MAG: hypothetical protein IH586_09605 [Anaerolineaceae bacterium]|nr:hypothetical protein [Anaerolineaceae bacterium]